MPRASLERARIDQVRDGERDLAAWVASAGLQPDSTTVLHGNVIDQAIAFAEDQHSPLLVAGGRRRLGVEGVVVPSVARELAGSARIPVAVVPAIA